MSPAYELTANARDVNKDAPSTHTHTYTHTRGRYLEIAREHNAYTHAHYSTHAYPEAGEAREANGPRSQQREASEEPKGARVGKGHRLLQPTAA